MSDLRAVLRMALRDLEGVYDGTRYVSAETIAAVRDALGASAGLDVERLARALRTMLGIDQRDDTRYDFGDLMPLARPYEAANAIAAAYLADDTEEPHDG